MARKLAPLRFIQLLLAILVVSFVAATAFTSNVITERQNALLQASEYNLTFTMSQGAVEFLRLMERVADLEFQHGQAAESEARLRYEIFVNRLGVMKSGSSIEFFDASNKRLEFRRRLENMLATIEPMMDRLDEPTTVTRISGLLAPFESELTALASTANQFDAAKFGRIQKQLLRLHLIFSVVTAGLILGTVALIALLLWSNRMVRRAHAELSALSDNLRQSSVALEKQNKRFDAALNKMSQGLCMFNAEGKLIVCNDRFGRMFHLDDRSITPGIALEDLQAAAVANDDSLAYKQLYAQQEPLIRDSRRSSFVQEQANGHAYSVHHETFPDGGWIATYEDISELRRVERRIFHLAHFDSLTDLANRVLFMEKLEDALRTARRDKKSMAILYLDLDRFKEVNDALGHHSGDKLLQAVAERLSANVRPDDLVARVGGDEFAVLVAWSKELRDPAALCARLIEEVGKPYQIDANELTIGLSIGIAEFNDPADEAGQLLRQADLALYKAKSEGKAKYRYFEPEMDEELQTRKSLETDLRKALANDELDVFYQEWINIKSQTVSGFEALIRWHHPIRGMVEPREFIPIAEDVGLISTLGEWVLHKACKEAMSWPSEIRVAVNLSPVQFRNQELVKIVVNALKVSGLPANRLELEITETVLLEHDDHVLESLHQLRGLGVRIAMDDFGTGYSSLGYLRSFPFDKIKIDQSFVEDMSTRPDSLAIVQLVIGLGTSLGMTTTAEGVNTEEQFLELKAAGCDEVQGYYFGRPKPASQVSLDVPETRPDKQTAA